MGSQPLRDHVAEAAGFPNDFRVACLTRAPVCGPAIMIGPAPSPTQAENLRVPCQMHHGNADATVPLSYGTRLDSLLTAHGVDHQLFVYPGEDHLTVRTDPNA